MPTLRDIRKRLRAIQNTKKITAAMKMVAAAKLRKVQDRMLNFRPYATKMESVLSDLSKVAEREIHPLFVLRPRKTVELLVITSDKGLCGAFNSNLLRFASKHLDALKHEGVEFTMNVVGRKSRDYFRRRNVPMRKTWLGLSGRIAFSDAQNIANDLVENYTNETIDEVVVIFNEFKSLIAQKVTTMKLLPIGTIEPEGAEAREPSIFGDYMYEPTRQAIFETLLPKYIEVEIYRALLESSAAEEAARMTAMENATKNCSEMIDKVTLLANKVRQASITKELMDVVGGVEALKG
ncbi:MAG: ATP synthase F1 subunit gamma [Nitrospirae bacterium]|jgi:F-type H+-transporting ATPase subunit gamma|nr:ATP synthase F1 subunit gamma [Nitrospirota bacterium]